MYKPLFLRRLFVYFFLHWHLLFVSLIFLNCLWHNFPLKFQQSYTCTYFSTCSNFFGGEGWVKSFVCGFFSWNYIFLTLIHFYSFKFSHSLTKVVGMSLVSVLSNFSSKSWNLIFKHQSFTKITVKIKSLILWDLFQRTRFQTVSMSDIAWDGALNGLVSYIPVSRSQNRQYRILVSR